jgi:hypothetical protein
MDCTFPVHAAKIKHLILGNYIMLQEIMKGLRECRNDSIEEADKKEAELDAQRKINCNLKEKLHNISTHKVHV